MSTVTYKNTSDSFAISNLEEQQKHITTPAYKNKVREFLNQAISNGDDISLDEDGNILCLQTKFYIRRYEWNDQIQDFIKVRSKSRRTKNEEEVSDHNQHNEKVEELVGE